MAIKTKPGGMQLLYGVSIGDALAKGQTSVDDLVLLRDQTKAVVNAQGDLVSALKALEAEIDRRGGAKEAPPPAGERLVAQIDGIALSAAVKADIEKELQTSVMKEIAKLDTGGDMVASPLAKIEAFGPGFGSHTPGIAIVARNLR